MISWVEEEKSVFVAALPSDSYPNGHTSAPTYTAGTTARQMAHTHQVVGHAGEVEDPRHFAHSAMPHFAQPRRRLQPAETFLDAFPLALADLVSRVPGGAAINRDAARTRMVLRPMRRHPQVPVLRHKPARIESLVAAYRHRLCARHSLQHEQRGVALRRAVGLQSFRIHDQPVPVFHQQMPAVTQLRVLPWPLRASKDSGSVFDSCLSLDRFSP
jgi:hypothetical protein